jgi:hypothetical protein
VAVRTDWIVNYALTYSSFQQIRQILQVLLTAMNDLKMSVAEGLMGIVIVGGAAVVLGGLVGLGIAALKK